MIPSLTFPRPPDLDEGGIDSVTLQKAYDNYGTAQAIITLDEAGRVANAGIEIHTAANSVLPGAFAMRTTGSVVKYLDVNTLGADFCRINVRGGLSLTDYLDVDIPGTAVSKFQILSSSLGSDHTHEILTFHLNRNNTFADDEGWGIGFFDGNNRRANIETRFHGTSDLSHIDILYQQYDGTSLLKRWRMNFDGVFQAITQSNNKAAIDLCKGISAAVGAVDHVVFRSGASGIFEVSENGGAFGRILSGVTGVTAGTYANPTSITVDANGRITAIS